MPRHRYHLLAFAGVPLALACTAEPAQPARTPDRKCTPVSERTQEVGCWIVTDDPLGALTQSAVHWHLDAYPSRAAAEADKGPNGTVIESLQSEFSRLTRRSQPP